MGRDECLRNGHRFHFQVQCHCYGRDVLNKLQGCMVWHQAAGALHIKYFVIVIVEWF